LLLSLNEKSFCDRDGFFPLSRSSSRASFEAGQFFMAELLKSLIELQCKDYLWSAALAGSGEG
jgi:hypothetical protein